ncbi:addiction module protein [Geotalea toluenoxydans]|uniref:addiction module protein n=1 Tax=Geotalea toluenoxydans TaxID=421624 RepID=UPI0006D246BF|nr:addiction module protein [Geotalea toluenoxydans]
MKITMEEMTIELLGLPVAKRALLAKQLISSLDNAEREDVEALWVRETEARYAEIENGAVECQPVHEALKEAREQLK